jgi:hypothetical protein
MEEKLPTLPLWSALIMSVLCVISGSVFGDWSDGVWFAGGLIMGSLITAGIVVRRNARIRHLPQNRPVLAICLEPVQAEAPSATRH